MITLDSPLSKGKHKGKSINQIHDEDYFYIPWIINHWKDEFDKEVINKYGWSAYQKRTGFGSGGGITNDDIERV